MEIRLIPLGFGTVAHNLVSLLSVREEEIQRRYGVSFRSLLRDLPIAASERIQTIEAVV